ncbi:riboflavin synthase subunit alpha [Aliidongia dinghuensis]|uniref:Riboflavin synthase n=1 Tax=Aliidongia dinghuensis TaxID=1867774 RepID=A0A8J2YVN4_9PROT|nr:riboflavin synthase [Aliidongia dinghuensis]GGF28611.1 riboflavin synthase subunit alpha [Aliidongia dinghuensis]
MFTGIITDVGRVLAIEPDGDPRYRIGTRYDTGGIALGASIAHSGVCLTVIATGPGWFDVQVSAETLGLTTVRHWQVGTRINLERALKVGDELGGHIVSGHVDGIGRIVERRPEQDSVRFVIEVPPALERLVARKGSIAIDGVSLTVNEVEGRRFGINIIPHTQQETTFGTAEIGQEVNLEVDMLARYVARLLGKDLP